MNSTHPMLVLPLGTSRLVLRDFRASDFDAVFAYAGDPELTRFMFYEPRDAADTRRYLQRMLGTQAEVPRMTWEVAVERAEDGRVIGACDLTMENPRDADLGFVLARDVWKQGYATEIARALIDAGFEQLRLQRIFGICDIHNGASARVLEKAGMKREATVYGFRKAKGRTWDMHHYEITREEWRKKKRKGVGGSE